MSDAEFYEGDEGATKGRGGKRPGAGRKPSNPKDVHRSGAAAGFEAVERFLVGKFGDGWQATDAEKKAITDSAGAILQSLEIDGIANPWAHLSFALACYAFGGKGRLEGKHLTAVAEKVKSKMPKRKNAAAKKGDDKTAAAAAPSSSAVAAATPARPH